MPYKMSNKKKYEGYRFNITWPDPESVNPDYAAAEVRVRTKSGKKYKAMFITLDYVGYLFKKNKKTGECASGTYFRMDDGFILVRKLDRRDVKTTIDDLIQNDEMGRAFSETQ